jgi:ribosomal protein S18 acetylase RimI-like enzyme
MCRVCVSDAPADYWCGSGRQSVAAECRPQLVDIALLPPYRGQRLGRTAAVGHGRRSREREGGDDPRRGEQPRALALYRRLGFKHVDANGVYFLMRWAPDTAALTP